MAVVKANYVRKGRGERETAKANIRYIQERPGRDKEKFTRPLFNNAGIMGRHEAYQFIDEEGSKGTNRAMTLFTSLGPSADFRGLT
jgi:hypothetical protein